MHGAQAEDGQSELLPVPSTVAPWEQRQRAQHKAWVSRGPHIVGLKNTHPDCSSISFQCFTCKKSCCLHYYLPRDKL